MFVNWILFPYALSAALMCHNHVYMCMHAHAHTHAHAHAHTHMYTHVHAHTHVQTHTHTCTCTHTCTHSLTLFPTKTKKPDDRLLPLCVLGGGPERILSRTENEYLRVSEDMASTSSSPIPCTLTLRLSMHMHMYTYIQQLYTEKETRAETNVHN